MGANAQTSVPAFVTGQVLTAQQQTEINTGIPVFADSTARDAAFGGTGEKTLAEGQYAYLESTKQTLVYDGSNWVSVGVAPGLVLVSATTIGSAVASVTVSSAFSATYDSYKIVLTGGIASSGNQDLRIQLGSTTTGYYSAGTGVSYSTGAAALTAGNNLAYFGPVGYTQTTGLNLTCELQSPFLSSPTFINSSSINTSNARAFNGYLSDTTSYTAFTLIVAAGTITGGTLRVYGYANS